MSERGNSPQRECQACPECNALPAPLEGVATVTIRADKEPNGCWRCDGFGFVDPYDDDAPTVVVRHEQSATEGAAPPEQKWLYEFNLWVDSDQPKVLRKICEYFNRMRTQDHFTQAEFGEFRLDLQSAGFLLVEIERSPFVEPEGVV